MMLLVRVFNICSWQSIIRSTGKLVLYIGRQEHMLMRDCGAEHHPSHPSLGCTIRDVRRRMRGKVSFP